MTILHDSQQGVVHASWLSDLPPDGHVATDLGALLLLTLRLCDEVSLAHRCGLAHFDIEPGNVSVSDGGFVHLPQARFRLNRNPPVPDALEGTFALSDTGAPCSSAAYMAPEQAWGRTADRDERTDVYGIGGLLYAILTRYAPHTSPDAAGALVLARSGTVRTPQEVRPMDILPPELCGVAMRALSPRPDDRQPAVQLVRQGIERVLAKLS